MTTERSGTTIIEAARDIMAVVAPTSGTRATGKVLIRSKAGKGTIYLPANWHFIPRVNQAAREELLFKTARGPGRAKFPDGKRLKTSEDEPDAPSWWTITEAGTIVDVLSVLGGKRHNLPAGTQLSFDPVHPDLEALVVVEAGGISGGVDPTWLGGLQSMVQFESLSGPSVTLDAFRAAVGSFPAAVIVWDGSEPADGTTQSSTSRGKTRVGQGQQLFKEKFNIFVLSKREDSGHNRRNEGLKLLDDLTFWLTDAMEADDQQFSTPTGIQVRGRSRIAGDGATFQQVYIYVIQLSVTALWKRYDSRTFNDWVRTRSEFLSSKDEDGDRLTVVRRGTTSMT